VLCHLYRALELALKGNVLIDVVQESRKLYLESIGKKETVQVFLDAEKSHGTKSVRSATKKKTKAGTKKKKQTSATPADESNNDGGDSILEPSFNFQAIPFGLQGNTPEVPSSTIIMANNNKNETGVEEISRRTRSTTAAGDGGNQGVDLDTETNQKELELDGFY
jgi:hypothetical protein